MILNFGKFKGQSLESLKYTADGVGYLEWGAQNLRDAEMRQAFADVLASMTDHDHALIMEHEDGIGYDEAIAHLQSMRAQQAEEEAAEEARNQRCETIIAQWTAENGQSAEKTREIVHRFMMNWEDIPQSRFSSTGAYNMFRKYMSQIWS